MKMTNINLEDLSQNLTELLSMIADDDDATSVVYKIEDAKLLKRSQFELERLIALVMYPRDDQIDLVVGVLTDRETALLLYLPHTFLLDGVNMRA